ncbi:MAG: hypothetical protein IPK60_22190 [Sandaracinaceae bacterium]|nr:hypothetical protein [Sandaracinaceae bacterium]
MTKSFLIALAALTTPSCATDQCGRPPVTNPTRGEVTTESRGEQTITLSSIPAVQDIAGLVVSASAFDPDQSGFDEARWRRLWATARPVVATDPMISAWSYSPWLEGSFATGEGSYSFAIFLGGLGTLTTPSGQTGYFLVDAASGAQE